MMGCTPRMRKSAGLSTKTETTFFLFNLTVSFVKKKQTFIAHCLSILLRQMAQTITKCRRETGI